MKPRIMYIEDKSSGIDGPARIGRVTFSKSGRSLYYQGRLFQKISGGGPKANYSDAETGAEFWISGCKRDCGDRLYAGTVEIDDDVRQEYWTEIRNKAEMKHEAALRDTGKYGK